MIIQNSSDIKTDYFRDKNGEISPVDVLYEKHIINPDGLIQLQRIPSIDTVFTITTKSGINTITYNKASTIINQNDFTVDYENGILTFHISKINSPIQVSYTNAIGQMLVSADRIFTRVDSTGKVTEKLSEILDDSRIALDGIKTMGDAANIIKQTQSNIDLIKNLTNDIVVAGALNKELNINSGVGKAMNDTLIKTINGATSKLAELEQWVTEHQDITNINSRLKDTENSIKYINDTELNINFFKGVTKAEKLMNMIIYATENNHKKVFVPSGIYDFKDILSDTIMLPEEFKKIQIVGENPKETIFKYEHLLNKPFIKVKGGSGAMSMGSIENIRFEGNDTTNAIQLADVCGFKIKNCSFGRNLIGVNFYNENGFTEYCIVEGCDFDNICHSSTEYTVHNDNSHISFNGSGLRDCTINQHSTTERNNIIIGDRALVYNAPMDFTIWTTVSTPIILHSGNPLSNCYGNIKIENFGTISNSLVIGNELYYVGSALCWGGYTTYEKVQFMQDATVHNGGLRGKMKMNTRNKNLVQGDNTIMALGSDYSIQITIIGSFYRYCGSFIIGKNPQADELTITKLNEHSLFDQLGKGHISLKGVGSNLVINVPQAIDSLNISYTYQNLN